jgi:hypothetical protein
VGVADGWGRSVSGRGESVAQADGPCGPQAVGEARARGREGGA